MRRASAARGLREPGEPRKSFAARANRAPRIAVLPANIEQLTDRRSAIDGTLLADLIGNKCPQRVSGIQLQRLVTLMMNEANKAKVLARLRRIAGQVEGIAGMLENDRYCVDVLLQIASAQAALGQAGKLVLRSHVETCVSEALASGKPAERKQKIDELMEVFARYGCLGGRTLG